MMGETTHASAHTLLDVTCEFIGWAQMKTMKFRTL